VAGRQEIFAEPGRIRQAEYLTLTGHAFPVIGEDGWIAPCVDFAK
jgi:hypothetical protein